METMGAPGGPNNCRVGAKTAYFAASGPAFGPLGALGGQGEYGSFAGQGWYRPGRIWHHRRTSRPAVTGDVRPEL